MFLSPRLVSEPEMVGAELTRVNVHVRVAVPPWPSVKSERRGPSCMKLKMTSSNRAGGAATPADPNRASSLDFFRYASLCRVSKHRCCSCGAPIRRRGVRRVVLCPVCDAGNELK